jgi:hypothetical protein
VYWLDCNSKTMICQAPATSFDKAIVQSCRSHNTLFTRHFVSHSLYTTTLSRHFWFLSRQKHYHHELTANMRTKFTSTAPDGTAVTHYTHEGAGALKSTTYQVHEKHLLAFLALLIGENLLKIAETNSNQKISDKISAARKTADGPLLTGAAVASRVRAALKTRAKHSGITLEQAQDAFGAIRQTNGIKVHKAGFTRASGKGKSIGAVEKAADKKEDASDSELSEL